MADRETPILLHTPINDITLIRAVKDNSGDRE
jgi:hypothetical protein